MLILYTFLILNDVYRLIRRATNHIFFRSFNFRAASCLAMNFPGRLKPDYTYGTSVSSTIYVYYRVFYR